MSLLRRGSLWRRSRGRVFFGMHGGDENALVVAFDNAHLLAVLQAAAFGIANLYTADQLRYVAPGLIGQEDVVARLFKISLRAVLSEAGMRAVETVAGDPFQDIPNKPE